MVLLKFSKGAVANPKVYEIVSSTFLEQAVYYVLNSGYRKSVNLVPWLKKQVDNPSEKLLAEAKKIKTYEDTDAQIVEVLRYVKSIIKYTGDTQVWKMAEYWQTAEETLSLKTGDCEDGAILIYVLARLKGIQANRLYLMAGDVVGGGHCFLGYRPTYYPLNWDIMDWCYWYKSNGVSVRNKFTIAPSNVYLEYKIDGTPVPSNYKKMWFSFNENDSHKYFKNK